MKSFLVKVMMWITVLGNLGVMVGCFLPFEKGYGDFFDELDSSVFYFTFENEENQGLKVAFVVMWIAVIVSWVVLSSFKTYRGLAVSILLMSLAIIGRCIYAIVDKEMSSQVYYYFFSSGKGMGAIIIELSYIALIVAGVIALGIKLYDKYFCENAKEKLPSGGIHRDVVYRKCPRCGKNVTEESKFCMACGFSMKVFMCPRCGTRREKESMFCSECGEKLPSFPRFDVVNEHDKSINTDCLEMSEMIENEIEEFDENNIKCTKCGNYFPWSMRVCPKCGKDTKIIV